ncbi:MAG: hypothetical protein ACLQPH_10420 [Acidimicrobiales bacterium]
MTGDGLHVEAFPPITDDVRQRAIDFLQGLLTSGKVDMDRFQQALDGLFGSRTDADLASVVSNLPSPVEVTPPARRRQEPFEINASMNALHLAGRWQVSRFNKIQAGMGSVTIDLSEAEFDCWEVDLVVHTSMGSITVIVPCGFDVRLVGRNGAVETALEPPIPGFPVVRLSATSDMGTIRVVHTREQTQRRRRRRRRRELLN